MLLLGRRVVTGQGSLARPWVLEAPRGVILRTPIPVRVVDLGWDSRTGSNVLKLEASSSTLFLYGFHPTQPSERVSPGQCFARASGLTRANNHALAIRFSS